MSQFEQCEWFKDVDAVVREPLRFKLKLDIGEEAYQSLRVKKHLTDAWDTLGVAATGAGVAKSSLVATTFFAPKGILGAIGLGTAATPVGWVAAAGIVSAGAWVGVTKYLKKQSADRVKVIPEFINTPMDVLALTLFDFMGILALKVAAIDGEVQADERALIESYFIDEWGFDSQFVESGLTFIEQKGAHNSIKEIAQALAEFKRENPDCNYESMSKELLAFLECIAKVDGAMDEREELAIERVARTFEEVGRFKFSRVLNRSSSMVAQSGKKGAGLLLAGIKATGGGTRKLGSGIKSRVGKWLPKGRD